MTPAAPRPLPLVCDDAPVSTIETMAELHARLRTRRQVGEPRWDPREIARSALGELSDRARAEFLAEMLCEMCGPKAREHLADARNKLTSHLHDLIIAGYDADLVASPDRSGAQLGGAL